MYAKGLKTVPVLFQVFLSVCLSIFLDGCVRVSDRQSRTKIACLWELCFSLLLSHICSPISIISSHRINTWSLPKTVHLESLAGVLRWTMFSCSFFEGQVCKHTRCHQAVVASCAEVFISQWDKPPRCTPTLVLQDGVSFSLHSLAFSVAGKRYVEN